MSSSYVGFTANQTHTLPIVECGYLAFQIAMARDNQLKAMVGNRGIATGFTANKQGGFNTTIELNNISDQVKFTVTSKYQPNWNKVADSIKQRSFSRFVEAMLPGLEFTGGFKNGIKFPFGELNYEGGVDFKHLPILLKGSYKPNNRLNRLTNINTQYGITLNIGPSTKGWAMIAQRVGGEALKGFLFSNNGAVVLRATYSTLSIGGLFAIVAAAVGVSFGLLALTALYAANRSQKGQIIANATWYAKAYATQAVGRSMNYLRTEFYNGDRNLQQKLIDAGVKDIQSDARNYIQRNNIKMDNPDDVEEAVLRWGNALREKYAPNTTDEQRIYQAIIDSLDSKAKEAVST